MPSSASDSDDDQSSPAAEVSDSFVDDDGEEEVEVEDDDDDDDPDEEEEEEEEKGEHDSSVSPAEADDNRNDVREDVKSQRREGSLESGSFTQETFDARVPYNILAIEKSCVNFKLLDPSKEPLTIQNGEKGKNASKECSKQHSDSNPDLFNNDLMNTKTTSSSGADGKEAAVAVLMSGHSRRNHFTCSEDESKQKDMLPRGDKKRIAPRLAASEVESTSLSPGIEVKEKNKSPAVICDFYAKGWCIKGSSCRFLHKKDNLYWNIPQSEGEIAANCKTEGQLDEGLGEITQRSKSPRFHDPLASSVGNNSVYPLPLSSGSIQSLQHIESKQSPKSLSVRREESFPLSFKDVGGENRCTNDYSNHGSLTNKDGSVFRNNLHPEYAISSSGHMSSANFGLGNLSSHSCGPEEPANFQSQRMHKLLTPSLKSHSPNASSSTLLTGGIFSSNGISGWPGSSLPFSYSSLNASLLGSRLSSFLPTSPSFSGSESENFPSISRSLLSAGERKVLSNGWEPSVPFQPSFLTRTLIPSPGSQYDPFRDSVELSKFGDLSPRALCPPRSNENASRHQKFGGSVSENHGLGRLACDDDKKSKSSHNSLEEKVLDNSCHTNEKDILIAEAEVVGSSIGCQNGIGPDEENSLEASDVKDTTETVRNCKRQRLGSRHDFDLKVDRVRQNSDVDVDQVLVGSASKALRHFRAALIEFVKEVLKPKWREGHLTKDAHKQIVKKAVEKILSTMEPQQIPTTLESVKQYLNISRPKIDKLVEGYAEIYGKL
ncbi:hypothetical protein UlMin_018404 [Ulmus minor]